MVITVGVILPIPTRIARNVLLLLLLPVSPVALLLLLTTLLVEHLIKETKLRAGEGDEEEGCGKEGEQEACHFR